MDDKDGMGHSGLFNIQPAENKGLMQTDNKYYAYMWLRADGTPYYVGKGKGNRAFINIGHVVHRPKDRSRILVFERNSEVEAFETEKELILNWGRKDLGMGCLYNHTSGGEGASGYKWTEEQRQALRELNAGERNPFFGKKHVEGFRKGHSVSEKTRQAVAAANKIYKHALGHVGKTGSSEKMQECASRGHHIRWHLNRHIVNSSCQHCTTAVVL